MYVKKEGKILYFCSSKCEKNLLKLRRQGIRQRWTRASRKRRMAAGKQASPRGVEQR